MSEKIQLNLFTLDEYEKRADETANYPGKGRIAGFVYTVLGLSGEAGEVANKVKKALRDDGAEITLERKGQIIEELGDVLWYVAMSAKELGCSLSFVAEQNIKKLSARKAAGTIGGSGDHR